MALETPVCGLCGQTNHTVRFAATIGIEQVDPTVCYSSSRTCGGHFTIVRCTNCGLVRSLTRDDFETRQQVYKHLQDQVYEDEAGNRQTIFQRRADMISRDNPQKGRLLDIGCSSGLFAAESARQGWLVSGIDPAVWAIAIAQKRIPDARFLATSIENAQFPDNTFDVITLWDVLEHIDQPKDLLQRSTAWLSKDGCIYLNLPNINSFTARLLGKYWPMLLREHLWYFSPLTIARLLNETGYSVLDIRPNKVRFSLYNIGKRLSQYASGYRKFGKFILNNPALKRLNLWLPTGEMQVVAKKV